MVLICLVFLYAKKLQVNNIVILLNYYHISYQINEISKIGHNLSCIMILTYSKFRHDERINGFCGKSLSEICRKPFPEQLFAEVLYV